MNLLKLAKKPTVITFVLKGALGIAVSAVIGTMIKAERKAEERIDEYFNPTTPDESENTQEN